MFFKPCGHDLETNLELVFSKFHIVCQWVKSQPHQLFAFVTFISRLQEVVLFKRLWTQLRKKTYRARLFKILHGVPGAKSYQLFAWL